MNKSQKILIIALIVGMIAIIIGGTMFSGSKEYEYGVRLGSAGGYKMIPDFNHNYFTDQQGKILLPFTMGGPAEKGWGAGDQATDVGNKQPLPYRITVRWFSIAENQFWEGRAVLDQEKLEWLKHYKVNNILYPSNNYFFKYFNFVVNYAPGGLVTVWVVGDGERYLVAQFHAKKADDIDWDSFIGSALNENISRKQYLAYQMQAKDKNYYRVISDEIQKEIKENKVPDSSPWLRLMHKYPWSLKVNSPFILKNYFTKYVNGEQYYFRKDQDLSRAVPFELITFLENTTTKEAVRIDFTFDQDEMINDFEELSKDPSNIPIEMYFDMNQGMTQVSVFLIKGQHKIELHKGSVSLRARNSLNDK